MTNFSYRFNKHKHVLLDQLFLESHLHFINKLILLATTL